jgi:hypothetical protein
MGDEMFYRYQQSLIDAALALPRFQLDGDQFLGNHPRRGVAMSHLLVVDDRWSSAPTVVPAVPPEKTPKEPSKRHHGPTARAMTHLGDVVFRHVCTHKAHIRARRGYEPTREAAMAAFAKSWRRE